MKSLALVMVMVVSASAEPVGEDDAPRSAPAELTAADVEGAPVPGEESGQLDPDDGESVARTVGRGVLFVPKLAVQGVLAPARVSVWAYERYHLRAYALRLFFDDTETYGLYPVAHLESQYGVNVGARFVHRNLFGDHEHLALHAGTGGRFRQITSAQLRSGDRLGDRFALELDGELERRPRDAFYGIGNDTMVVADDEAIEARFREQLLRSAIVGDLAATRSLHLRLSGALADFEFGRSEDGPPIDTLYPAQTMVGFGGLRHAYAEAELRWDTRRASSAWEPRSVRTTGWLVSGFAGYIRGLDGAADYERFGIDLQRFLPLGRGPRVLAVRVYGETVTGSLAEVPFNQLPRLGGKTLLRGYALDQFRDRTAAMTSAEYAWDLGRYVSASTFIDVGRVFPSVRELGVDDLRVGYGVAIEGHSDRSFLLRASLASSIDGGVFLDISFDPVFDLDPRVERR